MLIDVVVDGGPLSSIGAGTWALARGEGLVIWYLSVVVGSGPCWPIRWTDDEELAV